MNNEKREKKYIYILLSAALALYLPILAMHSYVGSFSRLLCDEFMIFNISRTHGAGFFFHYYYSFITGRFSLIAVYIMFAAAGPQVVPFLTAGALATWIAAATWTTGRLMEIFKYKRDLFLSFFLSVSVIYAALALTPNIFQSLYWAPGMFTYVLPLIFMTFQIGLTAYLLSKGAVKKTGRIGSIIFIFFFSLISAGFSETHALMVFFAQLMIVLFLWGRGGPVWEGRKYHFTLLFFSIAGTATALLLHFTAPGNHARKAYFKGDTDIISTALHSLQYCLRFLRELILDYPIPILMVLVSAFLFFTLHRPHNPVKEDFTGIRTGGNLIGIAVLTAAVVILTCVAAVPSFYTVSNEPPPRVLVLPVFFFILLVVVTGFFLSRMFKRFFRLLPVLSLSLVLVFAAGGYSVISYNHLKAVKVQVGRYAYDWDNRDRAIKSAVQEGEKKFTANPLKQFNLMMGLEELSEDPFSWVNREIAGYYGLDSIKLKKKKITPRRARRVHAPRG